VTPGQVDVGTVNNAVELGLKFRSDEDGLLQVYASISQTPMLGPMWLISGQAMGDC